MIVTAQGKKKNPENSGWGNIWFTATGNIDDKHRRCGYIYLYTAYKSFFS